MALVGVAGSLCEIFTVCEFIFFHLPRVCQVLTDLLGAFPKIFPLRLVWLSSVVLLFGGGLNAASSYMWAMASDCIPPARR